MRIATLNPYWLPAYLFFLRERRFLFAADFAGDLVFFAGDFFLRIVAAIAGGVVAIALARSGARVLCMVLVVR